VGESIRALIALLIGVPDPPLEKCIRAIFVDTSDRLKPIGDIIEGTFQAIKEEIAGGMWEVQEASYVESEDKSKCLRNLWELELLFCGRDKDIFKSQRIERYMGNPLEHVRVMGGRENVITNIYIEDLIEFMLRSLFYIVRRNVEASKGKYLEGAILDRFKRVLYEQLEEILEILRDDKWLKKVSYLPFCGRLSECIVCIDTFLEIPGGCEVSSTDLKVLIHRPEIKLSEGTDNYSTCQEVLVLISALLAQMMDLYYGDSEIDKRKLGLLSSPSCKLEDLGKSLIIESVDKISWINHVFPKLFRKKLNNLYKKLNKMPEELEEYILGCLNLPQNLSGGVLRQRIIMLYAKLACERKLLEYIVISNMAQDGVPVITSHKWLIGLRENSIYAEESASINELREKLDSLTKENILSKRDDGSYETKELDGLIYFDRLIGERLNSIFPCAELSFPSSYEAVGIVEVTKSAGEKTENDVYKLGKLLDILNYCLNESNRMFFGLLVTGAQGVSINGRILIAGIEDFMSSEGRLRIYKRILEILNKKAEGELVLPAEELPRPWRS
jgi:hypothetical protein